MAFQGAWALGWKLAARWCRRAAIWTNGQRERGSNPLVPDKPPPPWNGGQTPTLLLWASVSLPVYPRRPRGPGPARAAHLGAVGPLLPGLEDAAAAALAALVEALQPLQVDAQVQPVGQAALLGRLLAFGGAATAAPAVAVPVRHGDAARLRLPGAAARPAPAPLRSARRQAQRAKRRKRRPCAARAP